MNNSELLINHEYPDWGSVQLLTADRKNPTKYATAVDELDKKVMGGRHKRSGREKRFAPPPYEENEVPEAMLTPGNHFYGIFNQAHDLEAYLWLQEQGDELFLFAVGVEPDLQGLNYGMELLAQTDKDAARLGKPICRLNVSPDNYEAMGAYHNAGYIPNGFTTYKGTNIPRVEYIKDSRNRKRILPDISIVVPVEEVGPLKTVLNAGHDYTGLSVLSDSEDKQNAFSVHLSAPDLAAAKRIRHTANEANARLLFTPRDVRQRDLFRAQHADYVVETKEYPGVTIQSMELQIGGATRLMDVLAEYVEEPVSSNHIYVEGSFQAITEAIIREHPIKVGPLMIPAYTAKDHEGEIKSDFRECEIEAAEYDVAALFTEIRRSGISQNILPWMIGYEHDMSVLAEPYFRAYSDESIIKNRQFPELYGVIPRGGKPGKEYRMVRAYEQSRHVDTLVDRLRESGTGIVSEHDQMVHFQPSVEILQSLSPEDRYVLEHGLLLRGDDGTPSQIAWDAATNLDLGPYETQVVIRCITYEPEYLAKLRLLKKTLGLDTLHAICFNFALSEKVTQYIAGELSKESAQFIADNSA